MMEKTSATRIPRRYRWLVMLVGLLVFVVLGQLTRALPHPLLPNTSLSLNVIIPVLVGYWCGLLPGAIVGAFGPFLSFLLNLQLGQPDFFLLANMVSYTVMGAAAGWEDGHETRLGASLTVLVGHFLNLIIYALTGVLPLSLLTQPALWVGLLAEVMFNLIVIMLFLGLVEQLRSPNANWAWRQLGRKNFALLAAFNFLLLTLILTGYLQGIPFMDYFLILPVVVSALTLGFLESWFFALMITGFLGSIILSQGMTAAFREVALVLILNAVAVALGDTVSNLRCQRSLAEIRLEEIQQAYSVLSEADHIREQMIQNISHELRTPLSIMLGYTELLTSGAWGNLTPAQAEATQVIRRNAHQLSQIVEKVTVLDSVDDGVITCHPTSLTSLAKISIHTRQQDEELAPYDFELFVEGDIPPLFGDARYLSLSIEALLDNAVKFSPEGGQVTSRLWCDEGRVHFAVTDQGIGISQKEQKHLFECFYQVDGSTRRRFGGLGTGLALVKEVVRAHGGEVWVESDMGQGSTFGFWLPVDFKSVQASESIFAFTQSN